MYNNLKAEMARKNITRSQLAQKINKTPSTLSLKLNGKSSITLKECMEIKKAIGSDFAIDYLFKTDEV